ncbi:cathepsin L isoform X2 [Lingula anatina]|uniref:Cathepsin L isoform X2 n=1 Tax=Lingula anatina TaxID=7574 RepID=A0A1S3IID4_LINAN|nr:cathepsin L isoform X2 [Lingula anatina]|eukprot:XP_013397972.1 cathepsin L isoform X2 [Lingula anatina]
MAKFVLLVCATFLAVFSPVRSFGEPKNIDPNDEGAQKALGFAMTRVNEASNSMFQGKAVKTVSVTKQLVAGIKWTFKYDFGYTKCDKWADLEKLPFAECNRVTEVQRCSVSVLEQVWETPRYKLLDMPKCTEAVSKDQTKPEKTLKKDSQIEEIVKEFEASPLLIGGVPMSDNKLLDQHKKMFLEFKQKFQKTYKDDLEEQYRFRIFHENMRVVDLLNKNPDDSATYGATKFADLSRDEFKQFLGLNTKLNKGNRNMKRAVIPKSSPPAAFDWRDHGAVTKVKNQGSCGSCWAFSTTGNIEGQWAIKKKALVPLSEQELVDCDKLDEGCNGGLPSNAYEEIIRLGGLETETKYPYEGEDEKCAFVKSDAKIYINSSVNISKDESEIAAWLAQNGPVSIGINAFAMQFYFGGVSHPWKIFCNPDSLDHGVLIVGYGTSSSGEPYWIVKNSWGESWGEKGYYLVYRGDGTCGLNQMCTSAVVE